MHLAMPSPMPAAGLCCYPHWLTVETKREERLPATDKPSRRASLPLVPPVITAVSLMATSSLGAYRPRDVEFKTSGGQQ